MNGDKFEHARHARNTFPLTSVLSLRERREHSAPWADNGRGRFIGPNACAKRKKALPMNRIFSLRGLSFELRTSSQSALAVF